MEVYEMATFINERLVDKIPQSIIDKAPSAELTKDQTDEEALLPYHILDNIVKYVDNNPDALGYDKYCEQKFPNEGTAEEYNRIVNIIQSNRFKRKYLPRTIDFPR